MNKERVLQAIDNVKGSLETMDYGKWGALNVEQRRFIKELCNSWLILDDATNKQQEEIERLNNTIKGLDNTIENLEEVIKHKDSIIKEAIEYIEDNSDDMHTYISQAITQILKGSDSNVKD